MKVTDDGKRLIILTCIAPCEHGDGLNHRSIARAFRAASRVRGPAIREDRREIVRHGSVRKQTLIKVDGKVRTSSLSPSLSACFAGTRYAMNWLFDLQGGSRDTR